MSAPEVPASLRSWMSALSEIAHAVNAAEPLEALLDRVAEQACALIGFEYCAVMLTDSDGARLQVAGSCGLTPDYVALVSDSGSLVIHPPDQRLDTPAARAHREGTTVAVPDVSGAAHYGRLRHLAPAQGYRALLAAPLRTAAVPAGVVVGYSVAAREFGPAERELLELLADQAGLALETARLRVRQQSVIGELSRVNAELRRGRAVLEWAEQQHRALMELVLAEVGLDGLVTSLAETLDASVTVEDVEGRLLARAPHRGYRPPPDASARRRRPIRAALEAQDRSYEVVRVPAGRAGRPGSAAVGHPPTAGAASWVAPVVLGSELAGRLWVTDPRAAPEPVERRVIERFALVVGLELLKRRYLVDAEARLSGDLVGDILRADGPDHRPGVPERAAALGFDLAAPQVLAVLAVDPPEQATRWGELVRSAADPDTRVLHGRKGDLQVLLLAAEPDPTAVLRRVLEHAEQALAGRAVTLVAGPTASAPGEHATAYRVAAGVARLRRAHHPGGFVDVRDLGVPALLLDSGTPALLRRFAERLLGPVTAHDARRGGDLLATLRAWLASGCSTPDAASHLVVHPNTVSYRLSRIQELVGRSLRRADVRLDLQLALTVHDIAVLGPERPGPAPVDRSAPEAL
jgi:GAF domain-containing protein